MRDILLLGIVLGALPICFFRPWIGVLLFTWLGFMNPHRLTYGFAFDYPFSQIVAVVVLAGLLFSSDRQRFPFNATVVAWILLIIWMCITTVFALEPESAQEGLERTLKIQLMIFVGMWVMANEQRLIAWVWVATLSLAFYGARGGFFSILTGGQYRVWGPDLSFIAGNNELGLALIMTLPLLRFLQQQSQHKAIKFALIILMILTAFAVISTQSRGALVSISAMTAFWWLKSKHKFVFGAAIICMGITLFAFMPQNWHDRMGTIASYEEDKSATDRLRAWRFAYRVANQRVTGAGTHSLSFEQTYRSFAPDIHKEIMDLDGIFRATHSIYFGMAGQHGWIGLALFLAVGILAWRGGSRTIRNARNNKEKAWAAELASALQVSIVGYAAAGTFLSLEYFDFYYQILAMLVLVSVVSQQSEEQAVPESRENTGHDEIPASTPRV